MLKFLSIFREKIELANKQKDSEMKNYHGILDEYRKNREVQKSQRKRIIQQNLSLLEPQQSNDSLTVYNPSGLFKMVVYLILF